MIGRFDKKDGGTKDAATYRDDSNNWLNISSVHEIAWCCIVEGPFSSEDGVHKENKLTPRMMEGQTKNIKVGLGGEVRN